MADRGTVNFTQVIPPRAAEAVKRKAKRGDAPLSGALSDSTIDKLQKLKESLKDTTGKR